MAPLHDAGRIIEGQIRATVSETRVQSLLHSLRTDDDSIYSLLLKAPGDEALLRLALTTALLHKGRAAEAGTRANRLLHRSLADPALRQLFAQWQDVRQQREALLYGVPGAVLPAEYRSQLGQLRLQAESLEAQLSVGLPEIKKIQPPRFDDILPAISKRLPEKDVLIDVVWTRPYQTQATGRQPRWGAPHYIALLLLSDQRMVSIDLGEALELGSSIRSLLTVLGSPQSDPTIAAQGLHHQIFVPLLPYLEGITDVFLSLDGMLVLVPFDALHDGREYLLGRYRFHYLTSGRDMLQEVSPKSSAPALLIADPDFGQADSSPPVAGRSSLYQRLTGLPRLLGTRREAEQIAPFLRVTPLLGMQAREEAVHAAHSPWILHIATHGLLMRDIDLPPPMDSEHGLRNLALSREVRTKNVSAKEAELLPGEAGAMNRSALAPMPVN